MYYNLQHFQSTLCYYLPTYIGQPFDILTTQAISNRNLQKKNFLTGRFWLNYIFPFINKMSLETTVLLIF